MTSQEEDINLDSSPEPSANSKDNALFKPKPKPKLIRVLTVLAYILSVSMAAILLSIYYIFMWDGQPHLGARRDYAIFNHSVASIIVESANYKSRIQNKTVPLDADIATTPSGKAFHKPSATLKLGFPSPD